MDEGYGISHIQYEDAAYQATPWKTPSELLVVRSQLFGLEGHDSDGERRDALQRVHMWQTRGIVPQPVESTALLIEAQLFDTVQDDSLMALRMVHATAVLRFVTTICDAFQPAGREKLPMQTIGTLLKLPSGLVETRHDATHKTLPSLKKLQHATEQSIRWLWEHYWKDLDHIVLTVHPPETEAALTETRSSLQASLRTYLTSRKSEVKRKAKEKLAGAEACRECLRLCSKTQRGQSILVGLLVSEKMIIPSDRELGSSMEGAFLLWDPLFLQLDIYQPAYLSTLASTIMRTLNAPSVHRASLDPVKEALFLWLHHILKSDAWAAHRKYEDGFRDLTAEVLADCFSNFTHWSQKLAETLLDDADAALKADWAPVLAACTAAPSPGIVAKPAALEASLTSVLESQHTSLPAGWTRVLHSELPDATRT